MVRLKKNIPTLNFLSSLTVLCILAIILNASWVFYHLKRFEHQVIQQEAELNSSQKNLVREEVKKVEDYIRYMQPQIEARLKTQIRNRGHEAHDIAMNIYRENKGRASRQKIEKMVKDALRPIRFNQGRGYYFAASLDGSLQLFPDKPELEGTDFKSFQDTEGRNFGQDTIDLINTAEEGFLKYTWTKPHQEGTGFPKIAFVRRFEPFNWCIGTGEYLDDVEAQVKAEVLNRIEKIRFGEDGYIFAGQWDGLSLAGPAKGQNMIDARDVNGLEIVQEIVKASKQGGGFVQYVIPSFTGIKSQVKISYVTAIPEWQWYIGAGVYSYAINDLITQKKVKLHKELRRELVAIIPIFLTVSILALGFSFLFSRRIKKQFLVFTEFFTKASTQHEKIDRSNLSYSEFQSLAESANKMVDERQEAVEALQESENRLKSIIRAAPIGIGVVSNRIIKSVNQRLCALVGYSSDELVGQSVKMLYVSEEEFRRVGEEKYAQIREKGIGTVETRLKCKDGSIIDVLLNSSPIDPADLSAGVTFTALDITGRKQTVETLRESEERFRVLFEYAPDPFYINKMDGTLVEGNKAAEKLLGYKKEDLIGKNFLEIGILSPDDLPRALASLERNQKGEPTGPDEFTLHKKNGEPLWAEIVTHPVSLNGQRLVLGIVRDLTRRRQAEGERKKLEVQLRQAQKMEAIGTLAGGIAHDFNNILSAVIGFTEITLGQFPQKNSLTRNLQEVLTAGHRARDLVKQILAFSRQAEQQLQPVQVRLLAQEAVKLLRASLPTTIEIRQRLDSDKAVLADPTQVHQIIMNLCTNAGYAMREKGGVLELSLTDVVLDGQQAAEVSGLTPGPYLRLTVSDTGRGIRAGIREKIFDPFFTTKEKGEGTGMGLSVVHGIVKAHGGAITVVSGPEKGSTFQVYFPLIKAGVAHSIKIEEALPGGSEHVLLVDDEKPLVDLGQRMLEGIGYRVTTRTSSIEALELFLAQPDRFDLVITDMTMPNMTGSELAAEIMRIRSDIPLVLCTGYSDMITEEKAKVMGIDAFIMKPISMRDLAKTLRKLLDESIAKTSIQMVDEIAEAPDRQIETR